MQRVEVLIDGDLGMMNALRSIRFVVSAGRKIYVRHGAAVS